MKAENVKEIVLWPEAEESKRAMCWLAGGILFGIVLLYYSAFKVIKRSDIYAISSVGIMVAGACLLAGGVLDFLFGIPKTIEKEDSADNFKL